MLCLILVLSALLAGPPAWAQSKNHGMLEIRVKDHRDAIGDFSKLEIVLETILVSPESGLKFWNKEWKELRTSVDRVDLTKYAGKRSVAIFKGELAAGSFEAIDLKPKEITAILKKNQSRGAVKDVVGPIKLGFSVKPKETTLIVLDLTVMDMSDHPPRGYELQIKGYELYNNGKLLEKVPPG
jgi:hypothetical protein